MTLYSFRYSAITRATNYSARTALIDSRPLSYNERGAPIALQQYYYMAQYAHAPQRCTECSVCGLRSAALETRERRVLASWSRMPGAPVIVWPSTCISRWWRQRRVTHWSPSAPIRVWQEIPQIRAVSATNALVYVAGPRVWNGLP